MPIYQVWKWHNSGTIGTINYKLYKYLQHYMLKKHFSLARANARSYNEMRTFSLKPGYLANANGSCLVSLGNTKVICSATIEEKQPIFLRGTNTGWVTAEYSMLPASTSSRNRRESVLGKQSGRTQEIQRLIGRSLRASVNLERLGSRQIIVDCDVINADGGTRTASICGGFIAMFFAVSKHQFLGNVNNFPITKLIAAISCGIVKDVPALDIDYKEDSTAIADANFVMDSKGGIIEAQTTAENGSFSQSNLFDMLLLAKLGIEKIITQQRKIIGKKYNL